MMICFTNHETDCQDIVGQGIVETGHNDEIGRIADTGRLADTGRFV